MSVNSFPVLNRYQSEGIHPRPTPLVIGICLDARVGVSVLFPLFIGICLEPPRELFTSHYTDLRDVNCGITMFSRPTMWPTNKLADRFRSTQASSNGMWSWSFMLHPVCDAVDAFITRHVAGNTDPIAPQELPAFLSVKPRSPPPLGPHSAQQTFKSDHGK